MAEPKNRAERRAAERKIKGGSTSHIIRLPRRSEDETSTMLKHMAKQSEKLSTERALRSKQVKGF